MMSRSYSILLLVLGVAIAIPALPCATAHAQSTAELTKSLRRAMDAYDNIEFGEAERGIEDAIALARRMGAGQSREAAQLYIFLGVIRHAVAGEGAAEDAFLEGLTIDPDVAIDPDYATPTLEKIMARARARLPAPDPVEKTPPDHSSAGFDGLQHDPVETATAGTPIRFEASISGSTPADRVKVYYRRFGERDYNSIEMRQLDRTRFAGLLDGDKVRTSQIDYYIEATDANDKTLVGAGGALSPLNIIVFGDSSGSISTATTTRETTPAREDTETEGRIMYLHGGIGSGLGLATGTPVFNPDVPIRAGIAPAPLHFNTGLGFYLNDSLTLGAFMRGQLVLLTTGVELEPIFGGKLNWWFDNEGTLRLFSGVGGGYGFVRHTVDLNPTVNRVDTTREGPAHVGVGFGMGVHFNEYVALVLDMYIPVLFPTVSVQADAQLGLRLTPF